MARAGKSKKTEETPENNSPVEAASIAPESPSTADTSSLIAEEGYPTTEQIQLRAYEIYLERGGADGNDQDDWIQAERELRERQAGQENS